MPRALHPPKPDPPCLVSEPISGLAGRRTLLISSGETMVFRPYQARIR